MAIEIQKQKLIAITITDESVVTFVEIINKLEEQSSKAGFRKDFSAEAREFILSLITEIKKK